MNRLPLAILCLFLLVPCAGVKVFAGQHDEKMFDDVIYNLRFKVPNTNEPTGYTVFKFSRTKKDIMIGSCGKEAKDYLPPCLYISPPTIVSYNINPAVAIVATSLNGGGTGIFPIIYLIRMNSNATLISDPFILPDRSYVKSAIISGDNIYLSMILHGPDDPSCCPSVDRVIHLKLVGQKVIPSP